MEGGGFLIPHPTRLACLVGCADVDRHGNRSFQVWTSMIEVDFVSSKKLSADAKEVGIGVPAVINGASESVLTIDLVDLECSVRIGEEYYERAPDLMIFSRHQQRLGRVTSPHVLTSKSGVDIIVVNVAVGALEIFAR